MFDSDISKWDVSSVTNMQGLFGFTSFNGDLAKWDVSRVTDMGRMFMQAKLFNRDISKWDVSSAIAMDDMFFNAASFNQKLCGSAWVRSKASKKGMFSDSPGSISWRVCKSTTTQGTRQYVSRRPITERELIVRTPISTSVNTPSITPTIGIPLACPKCGTFRKSGRVSCCAPGGSWFKTCGGVVNKNVDHRWSEGVKSCKRKFKSNRWHEHAWSAIELLSVFCLFLKPMNTSSHDDDHQFRMPQMRHHR